MIKQPTDTVNPPLISLPAASLPVATIPMPFFTMSSSPLQRIFSPTTTTTTEVQSLVAASSSSSANVPLTTTLQNPSNCTAIPITVNSTGTHPSDFPGCTPKVTNQVTNDLKPPPPHQFTNSNDDSADSLDYDVECTDRATQTVSEVATQTELPQVVYYSPHYPTYGHIIRDYHHPPSVPRTLCPQHNHHFYSTPQSGPPSRHRANRNTHYSMWNHLQHENVPTLQHSISNWHQPGNDRTTQPTTSFPQHCHKHNNDVHALSQPLQNHQQCTHAAAFNRINSNNNTNNYPYCHYHQPMCDPQHQGNHVKSMPLSQDHTSYHNHGALCAEQSQVQTTCRYYPSYPFASTPQNNQNSDTHQPPAAPQHGNQRQQYANAANLCFQHQKRNQSDPLSCCQIPQPAPLTTTHNPHNFQNTTHVDEDTPPPEAATTMQHNNHNNNTPSTHQERADSHTAEQVQQQQQHQQRIILSKSEEPAQNAPSLDQQHEQWVYLKEQLSQKTRHVQPYQQTTQDLQSGHSFSPCDPCRRIQEQRCRDIGGRRRGTYIPNIQSHLWQDPHSLNCVSPDPMVFQSKAFTTHSYTPAIHSRTSNAAVDLVQQMIADRRTQLEAISKNTSVPRVSNV
jgi:hypothetical protein